MLSQQRGRSYVVMLLFIVVLILCAKVVLAIVPAYWNDHVLNGEIQKALLAADRDFNDAQFLPSLEKRLVINGLDHLLKENFLTVSDEGNHLEKAYELRVPFVGNIELLIHFKKQFSIKASNDYE